MVHLGQSALDCGGVLIDLSAGHILLNARCQIMDGIDPVAKLAVESEGYVVTGRHGSLVLPLSFA